jgi:hypothetical protein
MRGSYTRLAVVAALLLEVLAVGVASAEVVPHWRSFGEGLALGLVVLSFAAGLLAWAMEIHQKGLTPLRAIGGGLLCLLLATGAWLVFFLRSGDDFGLVSRRLVQSVDLTDARGELYVYEYEGVPDGFEQTVVMFREGKLPVMRPLVATPYRIKDLVQQGQSLRIKPAEGSEGADLHCNLETKTCQ